MRNTLDRLMDLSRSLGYTPERLHYDYLHIRHKFPLTQDKDKVQEYQRKTLDILEDMYLREKIEVLNNGII